MKFSCLQLMMYYSIVVLFQATGQTAEGTQAIGPGAVWRPGTDFITMVHNQCANQDSNYGACLIAKMPIAGAPPQAVAFTKLLEKENQGQIGYMRGFWESGRVDVAAVFYPLRANENSGCVLVNGKPVIIDVDQLNLLPKDGLNQDAAYAALVKRYPRATLFPGARSDTTCPLMEKLPGGGERFAVSYYIQNGCHACERLGSAIFAFDFSPSGAFLGAKFLRTEVKPSTQP